MEKTQLFLALTFLTVLSSVGLGRADIPDQLEASIGGMAGFYSVHLKGRTIVYEFQKRSEPTHTISFTPTRKDWKKFNSLLEAADVWNWETAYREPQLADGIQWNLYIKQGGREKKTEGSNRYPPPEKFKKYLNAMQLLIGNNCFQ